MVHIYRNKVRCQDCSGRPFYDGCWLWLEICHRLMLPMLVVRPRMVVQELPMEPSIGLRRRGLRVVGDGNNIFSRFPMAPLVVVSSESVLEV